MYLGLWLMSRKSGNGHVTGMWSMSGYDHDQIDVDKKVPCDKVSEHQYLPNFDRVLGPRHLPDFE